MSKRNSPTVHIPWHTGMMTPDVLGIVEVDGDVIEVSTGLGFRHERIYGVTYAQPGGGLSHDPRNGCHFSLSDVLAAITAERCARCAAVLDPSVFHDDDHQGRPLCVTCCPTCEHERHTQPCTQFAPAPGAASAWCDHCGWHTDHHDDDPPIGRAVTRIVNPTTTTKETTP